jgi:GAF domain-containing protein
MQLRTDRIHAAVEHICSTTDLDGLVAATRRHARTLTGADGVAFVLRAGNDCHYLDEDAIAPLWKGQRFPMDMCVSGWVMINVQSVAIPDVFADPRIPHDAYRPTFVKSMVMAPLRRPDPIGALGAYWRRRSAPQAEHVQIIELLADAAGTRLASGQMWARVRETIR